MGGVPEEFEGWYRREHDRVFASLLLVFGDVERARESTDEAFVRAVAQWPRVAAMTSPGGWVLRVALNVGRRSARRAALEQRLLRRVLPAGDVPGPVYEVWDSVRRLPLRQRTALVLRYVADLPEAEIASVMGVQRGTVASTLHDARRSLASDLEDDPSPGATCLEVPDARG